MNKTFSYIAASAITAISIIFLFSEPYIDLYPQKIRNILLGAFYATTLFSFFCLRNEIRLRTTATFGICASILGGISCILAFYTNNTVSADGKTIAALEVTSRASKYLFSACLVLLAHKVKEDKYLKYSALSIIGLIVLSFIEDNIANLYFDISPYHHIPHNDIYDIVCSQRNDFLTTLKITRVCLTFAITGFMILRFEMKSQVTEVTPPPVPQSKPATPGDPYNTQVYTPSSQPQPCSHLAYGSLLQGGKYQIQKPIGQGGFGITYIATQTALNRPVAIKEFFMKEYCERDRRKNHVTMGTSGSKEMVGRFKAKFIKEAQTIAAMENHHIVKIFDIFEENGTAYYVMEYLSGGQLLGELPSGTALDEQTAISHIRQICNALQYIHDRNILHLDIKPSNIMFRNSGEAVLIDFGISKHYDDEGGSQTSSTPIGISRGYAPLEQYNKVGIAAFSPATDIYSVGATLYKMVTGQTPADANEVYEDGLGEFPIEVSQKAKNAITKAMEPRRKDRPQNIAEFLNLLA